MGDDVVLEGSQEKKMSFVERSPIEDDPTLISLDDLTGGFDMDGNVTGDVLGEVVMDAYVENACLVPSWRVTEIDPIIVSDVGVGNGLIDSSFGGNSHASGGEATGAARKHASVEIGSQIDTDSGKGIMREAGMLQANEVNIQAHSRKDKGHALEIEQPIAELTLENFPFFVHPFFSQEKGKFSVSDLVWGKVKSHPWWPGQIVGPSDASTLAIKCQKKDTLLVAYFWDKTFAWCDESQLKPFFSNFSGFEKQPGPDTFSSAVKSALKEVCRRIDAGTMCSCLNEKSLFKVYPKIENAGMKQGFEYYTVDRGKVVSSLNPRGLVCFVKNLALEPDKGTTNKLLTVMSKYHIKAFHRWSTVLLKNQTQPVIVPTESVNLPEDTVSHSEPLCITPLTQISPSTLGSLPVDNSSTEYYTVDRGNVVSSLNPRELVCFVKNLALEPDKGTTNKLLTVKYHIKAFHRWSTVLLKNQTQPVIVPTKSVNLPEDTFSHSEPLSITPLTQISPSTLGSLPVDNSSSEKPKRKRGRPKKPPVELEKVDTEAIDTSPDLSSKMRTGPHKSHSGKRCKVSSPQTPSGKGCSGSDNMQDSSFWSEVSLRLQADANLVGSAAKRPVIIPVAGKKADECIPTALLLSFSNRLCKVPSDMEIIRIFSQYGALKGQMEKEVEGSQSQVKLVFKKRSDAEKAFGSLRMQNAFGPSLLSYRLVDLPSSEVTDRSEQEMVEVNEESGGLLEEGRTEVPGELNLTTLLLSFSNKSGKIPSEMDLIRMFSHHGPLKEDGLEKELDGTTCRFRVTFKKHSSAQMAFSSLRKQNVFGPSLLSYRLISLPVEASKLSGQDKVKAPNKEKHSNLQVPVLKGNLVQSSRAIIENRIEKPVYTACGLVSTLRIDTATDISVDPSSIAHGGNSGEISIAPSSIVQGEDAAAVVTSVERSSSVDAGMTETPINPSHSIQTTEVLVSSLCTIETCAILADRSSSMQRERLVEIPIASSNTEVRVCCDDDMPIELLSTGGGKTSDDISIAKLHSKDGKVDGTGKLLSNSSSFRHEGALNKAGKRTMVLENSKSAKPKPISSGSIILECAPSRSANSGCIITPSFQRISPLWKHLVSLEPFTKTPQQPHFKKLDRYCKEMRDGMAIGLMVTFANLVDSIKKLSIDDGVAIIEQMCNCLETLEENGFNVDHIRTCMNRILQIKDDYVRSGLKQDELEKEVAKIESESVRYFRLAENNRSEVAILDEQINALTELSRTLMAEKDRLLELTVGNGHEISRLKNELSIVNGLEGPARKEFERVLAESL